MASGGASQAPVPVILCGQTEQIGAGVIAGLKPEYEVVQFIINPEACIEEIPVVLRGERPATSSSALGTGSTSSGRPQAVILGGGYAESFERVRAGVEAANGDGGSGIAWLKHDGEKPAPPLGPEYGKAMIARVRETLEGLKAEGKLGDGVGGLYWY